MFHRHMYVLFYFNQICHRNVKSNEINKIETTNNYSEIYFNTLVLEKP